MTCLQTTIAIRSTRNEGAFIRRQHDHTIKLKATFESIICSTIIFDTNEKNASVEVERS